MRAVTTDANGKSTVTVALDGKTNGRTATRTVQTGKSAGGQIEITSGLKEGDQVVVTTTIPAGLATNGTGSPQPVRRDRSVPGSRDERHRYEPKRNGGRVSIEAPERVAALHNATTPPSSS